MSLHPVSVVGLVGGAWFGAAAAEAVATAELLLGAPRHLDAIRPQARAGAALVPLRGVEEAVGRVAEARTAGSRACVLASGDPGFFGIVRLLGERLGTDALEVHPAPSSVALAFGRLGLPWDDATVLSAHGRPLAGAVHAVVGAAKAAVLTGPDATPGMLGAALLAAGCPPRSVGVVARLGEPEETVVRTDLAGLAAGGFDHLAVVVLVDPAAAPAGMGAAWAGPLAAGAPGDFGQPEERFARRAGLITKAEVRAVALSKLSLAGARVLWDVGAGSGAVGIEAALLAPGLEVFAVEREPEDAERVRANAVAHGVGDRVRVVVGAAPAVLADLPDPDRAFVGGGGPEVLAAVRGRLPGHGVVVASFAVLGRAAAAGEALGNLVQLQVGRGVPIGSLGLRLAAENPVFLAWGR